jgi:fructokinase
MIRSPSGIPRLGIDLGGTKIEIVALGPGGEVLWGKRIPSPQGSYAATLEALAGLVAEADSALGRRGTVGIGIPGAVSPITGLIKNANSTWLIGNALDRDLAQRVDRPVRLENDANCFALSEATDGAGAGAATVFGAILGTGVGGGLVVRGQGLRGHNLIAGEWGHNPLPWPADDERPGPTCWCGKRGCLETWISGVALAREGGERAEEKAAAGDPRAQAALERYEDRLARALATLINVFDPDVIVLGGGLSKLQQLYDNVPPRLPAYVFSDVCHTPIRPPKHGDASGVRGAAWLWPAGSPGEHPG